MKPRYALILLLLLWIEGVNAQYRCVPSVQFLGDPRGLEITTGNLFNFCEYRPDTAAQWFPVQQIPFNFYFNGQLVTYYKVSNTGVLTFDTSAASAPPLVHNMLPNAQVPNNSICIGGIPTPYEISVTSVYYEVYNPMQLWITFFGVIDSTAPFQTIWSIILEEGSNNIYLFNQWNDINFSAPLSLGVQVNNTRAFTAPGSPNIVMPHATGYIPDCFYYAFIPGNNLASDGAITASGQQSFTTVSKAPFVVKALFKNMGIDTVTSLRLNYSINGGAPVSQIYSGLTIPTGNVQWFQLVSPWSPVGAGIYTLDIYCDSLSSGVDQDTSNDHFIQSVYVQDSLPQRKIMFEEFKGTFCPSSGYWTYKYDSLLTANANLLCSVKYEVGTDLTWDWRDDLSRVSLYQQDYVPIAYYNGSIAPYLDTISFWSEVLGNPWNVTQRRIDSLSSFSGLFEVHPKLYRQGNIVQGNVKVTAAMNIPVAAPCRVYCAMIEDSIFKPNAGYSSYETLFVHTTRKLFPSRDGVFIGSPLSGQTDSIAFAFLITDTSCNPARLKLVCFVQDTVTKEIYQCGESPIVPYDLLTPNIPVITGDSLYCPGTFANIKAGNACNCSYYWSNGDTGVSISVDSIGTYTVTAVNNYGSIASAGFNVDLTHVPAKPVLSGDTFLCANWYVEIDINNFCNTCAYHWSFAPNYLNPYPIVQVSDTGIYTVKVSTICGVDSASFTVATLVPQIYAAIHGGIMACTGHPTELYVSPPCKYCGYLWSDSSTTDTITINQPGNYSVTVTNECGVTPAGPYSVISIPPAPLIDGDTALCSNGEVILLAYSNCNSCTYQWTNDTIGEYLYVDTPGFYSVRTINACGVSTADSIYIYGNSAQPIVEGTFAFCRPPGDTSIIIDTLTVTNPCWGCRYSWSNLDTGLSAVFHSRGSQLYCVVTATNVCGDNSKWFSFSKFSAPDTPVITGPDSLCSGHLIVLTVINPCNTCSYLWNDSSTFSNLYIDSPGTYNVMAYNVCGTIRSSNHYVTAILFPDTPIITGSPAICRGDTVRLSISNPCTTCGYNWNTGDTSLSILVDTPGMYYAYAHNGCYSGYWGGVVVPAVAMPSVPLLAGPANLCPQQSGLIFVTNSCTGCTYNWSSGALGDTITAENGILYTVTASNICNDTASGNYIINSYSPPQAQAFLDNNLIYAGTIDAVTYQWYLNDTVLLPGDTSSGIFPVQTGNYSLLVTDSNGCTGMSNVIWFQTTGITTIPLNKIKVYPSVTSGNIVIDLGTGVRDVQYAISDINGKMIMNGPVPVSMGTCPLSLSYLASGVYVIRLSNQTGTATFKIIKIND